MRKKSGFTFVEQAIVLVPDFMMVVHKLEQQVTLRGQSRSTLQNYIRRIALFVIHFGKLPEKIDPEEINVNLAALARDLRSPSRSSFRYMVYGLRYYYRWKTIESNIDRFVRLTGINPCHFPVCKTGQMIRIRKLPPIHSPSEATCKKTHPQL